MKEISTGRNVNFQSYQLEFNANEELTVSPLGEDYRILSYANDLLAAGRLTPAVSEAIEKAITIRQNHHVVAYLAGALTGVDEVTKSRYECISNDIAEGSTEDKKLFAYAPHLHGTDPVMHPTVTPNEVRDIDYLFAARVPDLHINFLSPVAHGNAVELGWAETEGIPTVYVVPQDFKLSRLVLGMRNVIGAFTYQNDANETIPAIVDALR